MKKIKDRITLGIITGIIASIPGRLLNSIEYKIGLSDLKYSQMAASLLVEKKDINSTKGKLIGGLGNGILTLLTGTAVTYMLSITGRDKAVIKGMGLGATLWLGLYGLSTNLGVSPKSKKPLTPLLSFIDHIIFGASTGLLVSKLGDDTLFPDIPPSNTNKIPVFPNPKQSLEQLPKPKEMKIKIKRHFI